MKKAILAIVAACAICCIPLFVPALAGASLFGLQLFGAPFSLERVLCALVPAMLIAVALFFVLKVTRAKPVEAECGNATCQPSGKCGCK